MRIVIIEDEQPAARQLQKLICELRPDAEILGVLDSVEGACAWLKKEASPDLIFMDIQLADGLSFDIFGKVNIQAPVIFTTAFDQYALRAFKVNSVDYLLKPVEPEELESALQKYNQVFQPARRYAPALIEQLMQSVSGPRFKQRFLIKTGQNITYLPVTEIRYFYADDGLLYARTTKGKKHHIDYTLDQLEESLDPLRFFRLNRKVITGVEAIRQIMPYFNSRLIIELHPDADFDVIVSRDRVSDFKSWLDR